MKSGKIDKEKLIMPKNIAVDPEWSARHGDMIKIIRKIKNKYILFKIKRRVRKKMNHNKNNFIIDIKDSGEEIGKIEDIESIEQDLINFADELSKKNMD